MDANDTNNTNKKEPDLGYKNKHKIRPRGGFCVSQDVIYLCRRDELYLKHFLGVA